MIRENPKKSTGTQGCSDRTIMASATTGWWAFLLWLSDEIMKKTSSGVGIDVPTIGNWFHITKTKICYDLLEITSPISSWVMWNIGTFTNPSWVRGFPMVFLDRAPTWPWSHAWPSQCRSPDAWPSPRCCCCCCCCCRFCPLVITCLRTRVISHIIDGTSG